ncbi:MAG: hypothetical protein IKC03_07025 [Oscillospiraceae bacterium]|nr:hypothetical protein [Oscillospiraceae bacterium]
MILLIVLVILAVVYTGLPLWVKLIVLAINSYVPDPIPVLDEILMIASTLGHICNMLKIIEIFEWIRSHKILTVCIVLLGIAVIAFVIMV